MDKHLHTRIAEWRELTGLLLDQPHGWAILQSDAVVSTLIDALEASERERDEARRNESVVNGWCVEVGQRASGLLDHLGDIAEVVGLYRDETGPDLIERVRALRAQLATLTARVAVLRRALEDIAEPEVASNSAALHFRCCKIAHAALSTPPAEEPRAPQA